MKNALVLLLALAVLSSCGPRDNVLLPQNAFQPQIGKVQLVWTTEIESARVYGESNIKRLGQYLTGDGLRDRLNREKVAPLVQRLCLDRLRRRLIEMGFAVSVTQDPVDFSELPRLREDGDNIPPRDFTSVVESGAVYVLFLRVPKLGVNRGSWTSAPEVIASIDAYLIKLPENRIIAEQHPRVRADITGGEMEKPPEYLGLIAIMRQSFINAASEVEFNFLQ